MNLDNLPIIDNYEIDATGATARWPDTTHYKVEVPAGWTYWFVAGNCYVTQNGTCDVMLYNASDKLVMYLADYAAGTGHKPFPDATYGPGLKRPIKMTPGMYIQATFGAAQDASAYATCYVYATKGP